MAPGGGARPASPPPPLDVNIFMNGFGHAALGGGGGVRVPRSPRLASGRRWLARPCSARPGPERRVHYFLPWPCAPRWGATPLPAPPRTAAGCRPARGCTEHHSEHHPDRSWVSSAGGETLPLHGGDGGGRPGAAWGQSQSVSRPAAAAGEGSGTRSRPKEAAAAAHPCSSEHLLCPAPLAGVEAE